MDEHETASPVTMTVVAGNAGGPGIAAREQAQILEALLFSSPVPVPARDLANIMGEEVTTHAVRALLDKLNKEYEWQGRAFRAVEVGAGWQLRTLPRFRPWVQKLEPIKPIKLSLPTIETLSIVAYKQPITRAKVEFVRGVDSSYTLRTLLQKRLIRVVGKEAIPGRPILYGTTKQFLEVFGLKDIGTLPPLSELEMHKPDPPGGEAAEAEAEAAAEKAAHFAKEPKQLDLLENKLDELLERAPAE